MPRIPPITQDSDRVRELLDPVRSPDGTVPNVFATFAHHPGLLARFSELGEELNRRGILTAREREVVILRVAARAGSRYEEFHHRRIAEAIGMPPAEIDAVTALDRDPPPELRPLLDVVDQVVTARDVDDAVWAAAEARWDRPQLIEIMVLAGFYAMLAGFLNATRVDLDQDKPTILG